MKNKILNYGLGALLLATTAAGMTACGDNDTISLLNEGIYAGKVEMTYSPELEKFIYTDETGIDVLPMIKGESITLDCIVAPDSVTFDDVAWTSSDESVATVDEEGTVTALNGSGRGYSIIQVAPVPFYSGSGIYSTLKVTVSNELVEAEEISVTAPAEMVYAGESLQLTAAVLPAEATYRTVQWSSSDESVATVDARGRVTGKVNNQNRATVTITATALDGSMVSASKELTVLQIVQPQQVTIGQAFASANGYGCAINEKRLALEFTTVPADCTLSLIEWTSSDTEIATVENGVVTFNQNGAFGSVTITATCPETGSSSEITLSLEEGLVRELFDDPDNYGWYNAQQSGNGTSSSHVWNNGFLTVTTYKQNATKQRADFKCWNAKTWLHAGNYPIFAIRMEDVKDKYEGVTARNITFDASGKCNGADFKGGLDGNNNKWKHDYKCSDGSHVFIYDLASQKWATGGALPTTAVATFTSMQFKYADMATATEQLNYNVYWVQTFKNLDDLKKYIESEGLTFEIIK